MPSSIKVQFKSRLRVVVSIGAVLALAAGGAAWWAVAANGSANAPAESVLGDQTRMGAVHLVTADLDPMHAYYVEALGLGVLNETDSTLTLGREDHEVLTITEDPDGGAEDSPGQAGLYHSAFVYDDEASLAAALAKVARAAPNSYQGSADHAVSLAFYFGDPDGNGIELYADRPADQWKWKDGTVTMGSAPLDPNTFIREHLGAEAAAGNPEMGHVHLRVGNLEQARSFYSDTLGFAVTAETNGALFFAAGGYHHHIGTNTWSSQGAGTRTNKLGLGSFTVHLENAAELAAVQARLDAAGIDHRIVAGGLATEDPWGNTITLAAP